MNQFDDAVVMGSWDLLLAMCITEQTSRIKILLWLAVNCTLES